MNRKYPLLGVMLALVLSGRALAVVDVVGEAAQLKAQKDAEIQSLRARGNATADEFQAIDDKYLNLARQREFKRTDAIKEISQTAKVENLGQGSAGTLPEEGRGIFGDVDTRSLKGAEFDKVMKTARQMGYTVSGKGDYRTIKELNMTFHREATEFGSLTGSSAAQTETARGLGKETALGLGGKDANVEVTDNLKKACHTLENPPGELGDESLQEMGKMTMRNLKAAGMEDPTLRYQCELLKKGYSPEAAGIIRPAATDDQRLLDLANFQSRCKASNREAAGITQAKAAAEETKRYGEFDKAREEFAAKQSAGATEGELQAARQKVTQSKQDWIEYRNMQTAAKENLLRNQPGSVEFLPEGEGRTFEKVVKSNGETAFKNPQTGETLSPSQAKEPVLEASRAKLAESVRTPEVDVPPQSSVMKGAGIVVAVHQVYSGVSEGAARAGEEYQEGDSATKTAAKVALYSAWYASGVPGAIDMGLQAGNESMDRYYREQAEGKNPSWVWAKTRGAGTGAARMVKAMTWDPLATAWEKAGGVYGFAVDEYNRQVNENENKLQQAQTLESAIAAARDLTAQLQTETSKLTQLTNAMLEGDSELNSLDRELLRMQAARDQDTATLADLFALVTNLTQNPPGQLQAGLNTRLPALGRDADNLASAAGKTVAGYQSQALILSDVKAALPAFESQLQSVQTSCLQCVATMNKLAELSQGEALYHQVNTARVQATENQSTVQLAASDMTRASKNFSALVNLIQQETARVDDLRSRVLRGIDYFYEHSRINAEKDRELLRLRKLAEQCRVPTGLAAKYLPHAQAYMDQARAMTTLGRVELPQSPDYSALPQYAQSAPKALASLQPAFEAGRRSVLAAETQVGRVRQLAGGAQPSVPVATKPPEAEKPAEAENEGSGTGQIGRLKDALKSGKISENPFKNDQPFFKPKSNAEAIAEAERNIKQADARLAALEQAINLTPDADARKMLQAEVQKTREYRANEMERLRRLQQ